MAADDREKHRSPGRVRKLLDRLAEILRGLPPDRQEAFREYVDEQAEADDDGGGTEEGDGEEGDRPRGMRRSPKTSSSLSVTPIAGAAPPSGRFRPQARQVAHVLYGGDSPP
jgi:hypothetical protein